jgi:hypothetical protein
MSFNVGGAANQQGSMVASNYLVNIIELQNTVTSATGLSPIQQVQLEVNQLQSMVNFDQKRIFTNIISKFDTTPIQITDDINLSNSFIFQNGQLFTGGGGSATGGGTIISSGGTSILLSNTTSASTNAITFNVGGRQVFTFDGQGRALYYDPSGTGNRFWVSSATLIADNAQIGGAALGAAPGKFLQSQDSLGTSRWNYVSTLQSGVSTGPGVFLSSLGVYFLTGNIQRDAGRIDSNRNWFLGNPSLSGNGDLATSNDFTVIGGKLRYQGGGTPAAGQALVVTDALGTVALSNIGSGSGLSSFVVGDQIQSGTMSVLTSGAGQYAQVTAGANVLARFTAAGRLGISNSAPSQTLDVGGNAIIRGPLTIQDGSQAAEYVFTGNASGVGTWSNPLRLFTGSGASLTEFRLDPTLPAFKTVFNGSETIRMSTGGAYFGINGPYNVAVSGIVAAAAFASLSPLRFLNGPTGAEFARFTDAGNFGIGTTTPGYKLTVAGMTSNQSDVFVSTNLTVYGLANILGTINIGGTATAAFFAGNGSNITNLNTSNVGSGSNRLDVFMSTSRGTDLVLQQGISSISTSVFSTLNAYNLAGGLGFYSTLSSYIQSTSNALSSQIGPGAGQVVSSYSTSVGIALDAQFSTLSSYIVENTVQFSTLSSVITLTSLSDRAYASTISFITTSTFVTSTFLSTGGIFTGSVGFNYAQGTNLQGALDVSGLIYTRGVRGLQAPFAIGVGTSTTTKLVAGGWTPGVGWRYGIEGDVDISGRLFRNGELYTVQGIPDTYWVRNGSDIYFNDGNVGIGVINPSYPLDVAGRIRCFGVDVIPGPGPSTINPQGSYVSPWQYQNSNIYYPYGGVGIGPGLSSVSTGILLDVSGPLRVRFGTSYLSTLAVNIPFGSTLLATADIFGSLRATSLTVNTTGTFGGRVTARDFLSLSDRRYKTNIQTLQEPVNLLQGLRGVRFDWIDSGKSDIGLIAQEVHRIIPEAVSGDEEKGFHLAYEKLIPVLLECIKELQTRVEILEAHFPDRR